MSATTFKKKKYLERLTSSKTFCPEFYDATVIYIYIYICGGCTKGVNGHLTPFVFLGFLDS